MSCTASADPSASGTAGASAATRRPESVDIPIDQEKQMPRTTLGVIIGLALGFAVVFGSFGDMLIVALFAALGYAAAKVLEGDLDLTQYLGGRRRDP